MAKLKNSYFSYLEKLVCDSEYDLVDYDKLFKCLFNKQFYTLLDEDENRVVDALELRAEFERNNGYYEPIISDPVSVLEVMVALADRCEQSIMGNYEYGDRTSKWFWYMVKSLGLLEYDDYNFNEYEVQIILDTFLEREYNSDGSGGLFYIDGFEGDMRTVEIWYQLNYWLNTIED